MEKRKDIKAKTEHDKYVSKTISFILTTVSREKPALYFVYLGSFIGDFATTMKNILLPKFLLDELVLIVNGASYQEHLRQIVIYTALIVGLDFLISYLKNICDRSKIVLREWYDEYFQIKLADHAMTMDFEHTEDPDVLDQMNKAKEGIAWYSGGVVGILDAMYQIILKIAILISVVIIIFYKCPILIPIQLLALVGISIFNARNVEIEKASFLKLSKLNRIFGYVLYRLASFEYGKDIRLYDSSVMMNAKATTEAGKMVKVWEKQASDQRKNSWAMDIINSLRDGFSYFYIGYLALKRAITIGDFSMCVSSASQLYWSIHNIIYFGMDVRKRCNYAYQFLLFLEYPAAMKPGNEKVADGEHVIEFKDVSFQYPRSETYVLRHINLKIKAGEHLSIVGLNGAGKTTFIKLLCRLYEVKEGEICIDGKNIMVYSEEEYRKLFAVVFQDFQLFAFSLRENITLGEKDFSEEEVKKVLTLSGFYEDALKLEKGLDTVLYKSFDEKGVELSGGQQQKTAISRALYKDAPIVILDEPTAALDPVAEYDIYRQFNTLVGGKTAIYISHRLSSCKFCDHIAVFAEDTIKEYGTHDELVQLPEGIYANMFKTQAKFYVAT